MSKGNYKQLTPQQEIDNLYKMEMALYRQVEALRHYRVMLETKYNLKTNKGVIQ